MKNSPWGQVQHERKITSGVYWVSTGRHGGLMVAAGTAESMLTPAAVARGMDWGGYKCFEEDCLYAIPAYERPQWFSTPGHSTPKTLKEQALKAISRWHADYLIERGITPEPRAYADYLESKEHAAKRTAKDPDLIVAARTNDGTGTGCHVWTADNKEYDVTSESYKATREAGAYSLAACVRIGV